MNLQWILHFVTMTNPVLICSYNFPKENMHSQKKRSIFLRKTKKYAERPFVSLQQFIFIPVDILSRNRPTKYFKVIGFPGLPPVDKICKDITFFIQKGLFA